MSYTDLPTVRLVLSSVNTEVGGTAADLSDAQIQYEIDTADAIIDSYLQIKYTTPFPSPVPFLIKSISTDLAAYGADLNYRKSREYDSSNMPIIKRRDRAYESLRDLRKGVQTLPLDRSEPLNNGSVVIHQYEDNLFGNDFVYYESQGGDYGWYVYPPYYGTAG